MANWNERYSSDEYYYGTEPNDFLRKQVAFLHLGARVLCLTEGEGRNAVFLAEQGFAVTAVDGSSVGLAKLERLARERSVQVQTIVSDLADFKIGDKQWDAIVSIWCHVPPELRKQLHAACVAGLKPRGIFILEAYRPKQLEYKTGGPPSAELMMTLHELSQELVGLSPLHAIETDRWVQEGKGHCGMSAVVQFVGRKL